MNGEPEVINVFFKGTMSLESITTATVWKTEGIEDKSGRLSLFSNDIDLTGFSLKEIVDMQNAGDISLSFRDLVSEADDITLEDLEVEFESLCQNCLKPNRHYMNDADGTNLEDIYGCPNCDHLTTED
jgi:hypothetical protein